MTNYDNQGILEALERDDPLELQRLIVAISMDHPEVDFAVEMCLRLVNHRDEQVRANAILGFGHLSRRFGELPQDTIKPLIEDGLRDDSDVVRGQAWAAARDVMQFLGWKIAGYED